MQRIFLCIVSLHNNKYYYTEICRKKYEGYVEPNIENEYKRPSKGSVKNEV